MFGWNIHGMMGMPAKSVICSPSTLVAMQATRSMATLAGTASPELLALGSQSDLTARFDAGCGGAAQAAAAAGAMDDLVSTLLRRILKSTVLTSAGSRATGPHSVWVWGPTGRETRR